MLLDAGSESVTALLESWRAGDLRAFERIIDLVYGDLRRMAGAYFRDEKKALLQRPTDLVHDVCMQLRRDVPPVRNRVEFFRLAAFLMRRLLVDYARRALAEPRLEPLPAEPSLRTSDRAERLEKELRVIALDLALDRLAEENPRVARVVEIHQFVGLTWQETAAATGLSIATCGPDWAAALRRLKVLIGDEMARLRREHGL